MHVNLYTRTTIEVSLYILPIAKHLPIISAYICINFEQIITM